MTDCCPCDEFVHPPKLGIAAGLERLPRQAAGFPEYRLAMLRDIPAHSPLAHWRAREGEDLGIMLFEMWAYVLDVMGFYDEQIANECYLRTALHDLSTRQLVELIGYQPRPALAASVVLAAIADGHKPVILPKYTGFRSDAFDDEPPQVFETEYEQTIHKLKNKWQLNPVKEPINGEDLLFERSTVALNAGDIVVAEPSVAWVENIQTLKALDGNTYRKIGTRPNLSIRTSREVFEPVDVLTPTKTARVNSSFLSINTHGVCVRENPINNENEIVLDAIYPELAENDPIVLQRGEELETVKIVSLETRLSCVKSALQDISIPFTQIVINSDLPDGWDDSPERLIIHYDMRKAGKLTNVEKTHLNVDDFRSPGIALKEISEPLAENISAPSEVLLQDAQENGFLVGGTVEIDTKGNGRVNVAPSTDSFDPALRTPVNVYGNLVRATRGESVFNEVLGSGDATQIFQTFKLANHPLTYFNDPLAPNGRRNTLEIRVNGIKWAEVPSFFGSGPEDQVYIVRQNEKEEFIVTFGNGTLAARLPTGIENVVADYRFGAGAAKPPAGATSQLARPVQGLGRVISPLEPGGGADGDQAKDIKINASVSALTFGRAVSLIDFEALAREFGGVINAEAHWAWDESVQRAVVKIWYISDGGNIRDDLENYLRAQSAPDVPIRTEQARAQLTNLAINLVVDEHYDRTVVHRAVIEKLTNDEDGILSPGNISIARPLFRSQIFKEILSTEGVNAIEHVTVDGSPVPFALKSNEGEYRVFDIKT